MEPGLSSRKQDKTLILLRISPLYQRSPVLRAIQINTGGQFSPPMNTERAFDSQFPKGFEAKALPKNV
jgi:hypothetical protein